MIDQLKLNGWPSMSVDRAPVSCTVAPTGAVWFAPALAVGAELNVFTVTLSGALLNWPSFTTS